MFFILFFLYFSKPPSIKLTHQPPPCITFFIVHFFNTQPQLSLLFLALLFFLHHFQLSQGTIKMKRKANSQKLELKLSNLSPPRATGNNHPQGGRSESPKHSGSSSPSSSSSLSSASSSDMSIESSCVSSEAEETTSSPERPAAAPMVLVGCPRCLMYVMLSEVDPKCPRCKSTVLLDFLGGENSRKPN